MRYSPYILLLVIFNCSIIPSYDVTYAQSSDDKNTPRSSSNNIVNILTGKAWERDKSQEEDFLKNIEFGQGRLYFKGRYGGNISKDINQIDIKDNRYINFSFIICDFQDIYEEDYETNIYSVNIKLINTDDDIIVKKYIEFPSNIEEKVVSIDMREFSHFISTNTIIKKFIISDPSYQGKWGFKKITITKRSAGILLRYDGYGYAPEERKGTSIIPQPFIKKGMIDQKNNLIKEGDIYLNEGTVYNDKGGILSLFGYIMLVTSGGWVDIVIPDEFIIDIKENPILSLDAKTEAEVFSFNIMIRNTDGHIIIGNNDTKAFIDVYNTEKQWENHKIDLGEIVSDKISNTKIKLIRFRDLEVTNRGETNRNYFEIELAGLHFEK